MVLLAKDLGLSCEKARKRPLGPFITLGHCHQAPKLACDVSPEAKFEAKNPKSWTDGQ